MTSLWANIPFKHPEKAISPEADAGVESYNMFHDMKQDDGMHPAAFEHRPSDPIVTVPAHTVHPDTLRSISNNHLGENTEEKGSPEDKTPTSKHRLPRFFRRYWILILVFLLAVVGLAIGLGLGLTMRNKAHGAEAGSGISALDLGDGSKRMTLYFQHHTGKIRQAQDRAGVWTGGNSSDEVLSNNARSGTPLMSVSYTHNDELTWRVFYIDDNNLLQESINSNKSTGWSSGPLGTSKFEASASANAGLTACFNNHWYGDPFGLRLYYGSAQGSVQEVNWQFGDTAWTKGDTFPDSNPNGGCECTVRGSSITNLWLLNTKGELEQRWKDFNISANSTAHQAGIWIKQLTYGPTYANTSVAAINYASTKNVHIQAPNSTVIELIANGTAENTTWQDFYQVGNPDVKGMAGTKISTVVLNTTEGGQEIHVLFQEDADRGKTVSDFVRTLAGGTWAKLVAPVGTN